MTILQLFTRVFEHRGLKTSNVFDLLKINDKI